MQRRTLLKSGGSLVLSLGLAELAFGATIITVRVWPAPEYSRVTIESDSALSAKQTFLPSPPRLAVDIEGITLNAALKEVVAKVRADDPNIAGIRVGQFAPSVVRLVVDLKVPIRPQVFTLTPVAAYQHRLVLDLYPAEEVDPLEALIAQHLQEGTQAPGAAAALAKPASAPVQSAAIDPLGDLISQHTRKPGSSGEALAAKNATQPIANASTYTGASGQNDDQKFFGESR